MSLVPRLKPCLDYREIFAALRPSRDDVPAFEKAFAQKFENKWGVMFPYGRSGLYTLMKAWELKEAEVIMPAYSCVVVAHAIVTSGNIPVFVDCAPNSFNMSYDGIKEAMTEKTRCVIATHLFGYPMDVNRVQEIVEEAEKKYDHKIYVIQDAAHSYGCRFKGELVTKFGDAAIFGCNISKIMTTIFGGMVITSQEETFEKVKAYRDESFKKPSFVKSIKRFCYLLTVSVAFYPLIYGLVHWLERKGCLNAFTKYYDEAKIEMPKDFLDLPLDIEARVGLVQLKKYDDMIKKRIQNAKDITEHYSQDSRVEIPPFEQQATYSHCVGLVKNPKEWEEEFYRKGIQLGRVVEYSIPAMESYHSYSKGQSYPTAERYSKEIINFPNFPDLPEQGKAPLRHG